MVSESANNCLQSRRREVGEAAVDCLLVCDIEKAPIALVVAEIEEVAVEFPFQYQLPSKEVLALICGSLRTSRKARQNQCQVLAVLTPVRFGQCGI